MTGRLSEHVSVGLFGAIFGWLSLFTVLTALLRDSGLAGVFAVIIFITWLALAMLQSLQMARFKALLQERMPAIIERRRIGSLHLPWNSCSLLGASQERAVLSDDVLGPTARRLAAIEFASSVWFAVVWLGGLMIITTAAAEGQRGFVSTALIMLILSALLSLQVYSWFRGPRQEGSA